MILAGRIPILALVLAALPVPAIAGEARRDLVFLAENRPVIVRLEIKGKDQPFEDAWIGSIRAVHKTLDRDGDGKLTVKEADPAILAALARLAVGAGEPAAVGELDVNPKDGVVSLEELAEGLRPILGSFRLQVGRQVAGRTDALFDQLDRNKDAALTKPELAVIGGTLRPLDLDDNDMISAEELEPFNNPAVMAQARLSDERKARLTTLPPVVELIHGESSLRLARLFLKKYDKGKDGQPGRLDNKLSPEEFAIGAETFAAADRNSDGLLDTDELRKFLADPPADFALTLTFPPEPSERATIEVNGEGGGGAPNEAKVGRPGEKGGGAPNEAKVGRTGEGAGAGSAPNEAKVRRLGNGDIELAIGQVRVDLRVDNGEQLAAAVQRFFRQRFKALDANNDGYLEGKEREAANVAGLPLARLIEVIDRDGDGKVYLKEWLDFAGLQIEAARGRLVAEVADQGRAIFGILDQDKDRRLSARELQRTVGRVTSWDSDGDGMVAADDIPYHFQFNLSRAGLPGLTGANSANVNLNINAQVAAGPSAAPVWFQRMDRNHDGDISRREFLGSRDQFDRLDRDKDGLIDSNEARVVEAK